MGGCSARRELLRCLVWEAGPEKVASSRTVFGLRPPEQAFAAACARLGVGDEASPLDPWFARIRECLGRPLEHVTDMKGDRYARFMPVEKLRIDSVLKGLGRGDVPPFVLACATVLRWLQELDTREPPIAQVHACTYPIRALLQAAGVRKVPWTPEQINAFIREMVPPEGQDGHVLLNRGVEIIGDLLMRPGFPEMLDDQSRACLPRVRDSLAGYTPTKLDRERLQAVDKAMPKVGTAADEKPFHEIHPWASAANAAAAGLAEGRRAAFAEVCRHASTCNPSRVSKDWNAEAMRLIEASGDRAGVCAALGGVLEAARANMPLYADAYDHETFDRFENYHEREHENTYRLLGLACFAGVSGDSALAGKLAECVEASAKATFEQRYQLVPFATACVRALALPADPHLHVLSRVALRVKWPPVRKLVTKLLAELAKRSGVSPQEAEETSVPDFGLRGGRATVPVGDGSANVEVIDAAKPRVTWRTAGGGVAKSPAALKKAHPDAVAGVQQTLKDIAATLPAQRTRLELLMRDARTWRLDVWRQRYLDHGLLGPLVRRLIWTLDGVPVLFIDGKPQDVDGRAIEAGKTADVAIWHPVGRAVEEVVAWRRRLAEAAITQPFKQAHREVYLLTDAERNTRTYSNRFAAHILKAPAFLAVGQVRRWKVSLYGMATLDLPQFDLRAEFWSNEAGDQQMHHGGPQHLATDQVRFYGGNAREPMLVADVPPVPFSEVMRDVDLFVGVASVGNDPAWHDGGPQGRYRDYWQGYSFGELGATAKTRRDVLESLVPRLKIRDRASLTDRFLVVRGDKRTYKIHLGSGNILMEPNDQYLCIVPARGAAAEAAAGPGGDGRPVFLPFEGDATLSIILSKAFMLAEDTKITDPTIVSQIGRA